MSTSPAAYDRISSRAEGSTLVSPRTVLTITGKKTIRVTMKIRASGLSTPNQALEIGAMAMIGMELAAIATGMSASRAVAHRAVANAAITPSVTPTRKPASASKPV